MDGMPPRRDAVWFAAFFAAHHRDVLRYAARRVPDEADDIVAEVFAIVWRSRTRVPEPATAWLYATARHVILHHNRGTARRARLASRLAGVGRDATQDTIDPSDAVADRVDAHARAAILLARLSARDAEVLRLWAWEGLEGVDLATALGCSVGAARVRLHRAARRAQALISLAPVADLLNDTPSAARDDTLVETT